MFEWCVTSQESDVAELVLSPFLSITSYKGRFSPLLFHLHIFRISGLEGTSRSKTRKRCVETRKEVEGSLECFLHPLLLG